MRMRMQKFQIQIQKIIYLIFNTKQKLLELIIEEEAEAEEEEEEEVIKDLGNNEKGMITDKYMLYIYTYILLKIENVIF